MFLRSAVLIAFLLAGCSKDTVAQDLEKALQEKTCEDGKRPISVSKTGKVFCVKGPLCSGDSSDGRCPEPQGDLSFGSYCGKLETKAFGCIPLSLPPAVKMEAGQHEDLLKPDCSIMPNLEEVPVKGIGELCAPIPGCKGNVTGNCPVTLTDLNETYRCVPGGKDGFVCE